MGGTGICDGCITEGVTGVCGELQLCRQATTVAYFVALRVLTTTCSDFGHGVLEQSLREICENHANTQADVCSRISLSLRFNIGGSGGVIFSRTSSYSGMECGLQILHVNLNTVGSRCRAHKVV